jgi:hypothetical protein
VTFFYFFIFRPLHVARAWAFWGGGVRLQHPHFLKLAPTLGGIRTSIPHKSWRFNFFLNLEYT